MGISRRSFLSLLGTSVAGAAAISAGAKLAGTERTMPAAHLDAWHVVSIEPMDRGAIPVLLENRTTGAALRLDVCRRGTAAAPVAESQDFAIYIANGGSGSSPTSREDTLVARAMARRLDSDDVAMPEAMLTMHDRLAQHPDLYGTGERSAKV